MEHRLLGICAPSPGGNSRRRVNTSYGGGAGGVHILDGAGREKGLTSDWGCKGEYITGSQAVKSTKRAYGPTHFSCAYTCRRRAEFYASSRSVRRRRHCSLPQGTTCGVGGSVWRMGDRRESRASGEPSMLRGQVKHKNGADPVAIGDVPEGKHKYWEEDVNDGYKYDAHNCD